MSNRKLKINVTTLLILITFVLLLLDQTAKILVKTNMMIGDEYNVIGNWFKIHFIENNGMAFGLELGGDWGKMVLSLFRIGAVVAIGWYISHLIKAKAPFGVLICFTLIFCGAIGNIIDSMFYGMIFSNSYSQVATLFPPEGGYSSFLHGKVVDMLYFPLYEGFLPDWIPFKGGDYFIFFRPVFNLADSYITIGVIALILFYRKFFSKSKTEEEKKGKEKEVAN